MTHITYRDGLSILELVVYLPSLIMALVMGYRHGYGRGAGWYFFILFSLLRMIGNGCYLGTMNDPENENLYIAYGVCNAVGLSPMLMAMLALQSRLNDSVIRRSGSGFWPQLFRGFSLLTLLGIILSIVGMTMNGIEKGMHGTEMKVAMIIYVVSWVAVAFFCLLFTFRFGSIEKGEHRLLFALIICVPILAVRLAYSVISVFSNLDSFNMLTGNTTIFLVMDIIEEIAIVYIILLVGMTLERHPAGVPVSKESGPAYNSVPQQQDYNSGYGNGNTGYSNGNYAAQGGNGLEASRPPFQPKPYHGGPIHRLFQFAGNKLDESRYNRYGAQ